MCDEATIKALIDDLLSKIPGKTMQAQKALVTCGEPAVAPLLDALKNHHIASSTAPLSMPTVPSDLSDQSAIQNILNVMMRGREEFDSVLHDIVLILAEIGDERAIEPIIETFVTANAMTTGLLAASMERFGSKAIDPLTRALQSENPRVRATAATALYRLPDLRALIPLISLVDDSDPAVQRTATQASGRLRDPRAIEPLLKLLHSDDRQVRHATVSALGDIGSQAVIDPLIDAMQNDEDPETRRLAAFALRKVKDARVVEPLINALRDPAPIVPIWARYALDNFPEQARPYLQKLHQEEPHLIERAYNTWSWEWVTTSREDQHPELVNHIEEVKRQYADSSHACPVCGKAANELAWFHVSTPPEMWQKLMGQSGWMTVCDDCHIQVDYFGGAMN